MSFFSNFSSDHCPGPITGNPMTGLCEKVCIQAEKIFDAGIIQTRLENYTLTLTDLTPADPTYPLTFVSARSLTGTGTVSNLSVERQPDSCCARVLATVTSVMPFTVTAVASCVSPEGTFNEQTQTFSVSACVTCILKVAMQVELLVPAYGYCAIPPAQEYSQEVCSGFFELPLYPQGRGCCKK